MYMDLLQTDGSGLALYASSQIDRSSSWKVSSSISCPQLEQNVKVVPQQQQKGLEQTILHLEVICKYLDSQMYLLFMIGKEVLDPALSISSSSEVKFSYCMTEIGYLT
ncbi:hypothetical protein Syun_029949 [Stephania yunnanensis]|uniref:Uncharacterized protein n=1 Tax=Stephania yunnanensis TaxID=152371 RepID=A0AAP0HLU6_9MAGN